MNQSNPAINLTLWPVPDVIIPDDALLPEVDKYFQRYCDLLHQCATQGGAKKNGLVCDTCSIVKLCDNLFDKVSDLSSREIFSKGEYERYKEVFQRERLKAGVAIIGCVAESARILRQAPRQHPLRRRQ